MVLDQGRLSSSPCMDISMERTARKLALISTVVRQLLFLQDPAHGATEASRETDLEKHIRSPISKPYSCKICARLREVGMRYRWHEQMSPGRAASSSAPLRTVRVEFSFRSLGMVESQHVKTQFCCRPVGWVALMQKGLVTRHTDVGSRIEEECGNMTRIMSLLSSNAR